MAGRRPELKDRHLEYTERQARDAEGGKIVCPGGELVLESRGGVACRCRVEHSTISARENPTSLLRWCMGAYTTCPTWVEEKKKLVVAPLVRATDTY